MKCIKCQNDATYKDRTDGHCPKCRAKFAFEPKNGDPFTDVAFAHALDKVSSGHTVRFSEAHLFYELARKQARDSFIVVGIILSVVVGSLVLGFGLAAGVDALVIAIGLLIAVGLGIFVGRKKGSPVVSLSPTTVRHALGRWVSVHGMPPKLMQPIPLERADASRAPREMPKELAVYSFDRAVICDRQETVDMLLANNFHFENNCALLSVDGYPHAVFASVREMLRRNPRIEVYALHDASARGEALAPMLASDPAWFRGIGRVIDVGLSVRHVEKMRGLWVSALGENTDHLVGLSAKDRAWLTAYRVELASIRPEQVIKRLFRAMTRPGTGVAYNDVSYYIGGDSFGTDAGTSDGGGDSFG